MFFSKQYPPVVRLCVHKLYNRDTAKRTKKYFNTIKLCLNFTDVAAVHSKSALQRFPFTWRFLESLTVTNTEQ